VSRQRVLVAGAAGQLGSAIVALFRSEFDVTPLTRADLDITNDRAVAAVIPPLAPAIIINCAAYNNVDGAEDAPLEALAVNAFAVRALARAARTVDALFVHYSTDFVFDGHSSRPYTEDDQPNPRSVYAASKLLGEWFARDAPRHYVLRVESLLGGERRTSSVDRIADAIFEGREARVFADRTLSPSYTPDVAWATRELIDRRAPVGLYHCVNGGSVTWAGLAQEAVVRLGMAAQLVPVSVADVKLRAQRPQFAALSNARLSALGIVMPSWTDALARYLEIRAASRSASLLE
jgi:dTDP-4-dehydrorhamnose reductase